MNSYTTKDQTCLYCDKRARDDSRHSHIDHLKHCPLNENLVCDKTMCADKICDDITKFSSEIVADVLKVSVRNGEYKSTYGGMGCTWFIRNNDETYEYLFMHTDNWGQYGDDLSDVPRYKAFIYGFTKAD